MDCLPLVRKSSIHFLANFEVFEYLYLVQYWPNYNAKLEDFVKLGVFFHNTVRPQLSGHPRDFEKWPLKVSISPAGFL